MQQDEIENKTSLMVKWLRFCPFTVEDASLIPGWGARIPHAVLHTPKNFFENQPWGLHIGNEISPVLLFILNCGMLFELRALFCLHELGLLIV